MPIGLEEMRMIIINIRELRHLSRQDQTYNVCGTGQVTQEAVFSGELQTLIAKPA